MSKKKEGGYQGNLDKDKQCVELSLLASCITTITCNKCMYYDEYEGDSFDCMDVVYEDGWRVVNDKILCNVCQKQKEVLTLKENKNGSK